MTALEDISGSVVLQYLHQATSIPVRELCLSLGFVGVSFVLHQYGLQRLCVFVGLVFPLFHSFEALELGEEDDVHEQRLWLIYWIVYGIFQTCFVFLDWMLEAVVPFYYVFKLLFVIWLFHNRTKGAVKIYMRILHSILQKQSDYLEQYFVSIEYDVSMVSQELSSAGASYLPGLVTRIALAGLTPKNKQD